MSSDGKFPHTYKESGQALVEFALVMLFVIVPVLAIIVDGSITLYTQAALTNVAREGARAGSIYLSPAPVSGTFEDQYAAIDSARAAYVTQEVQRMIGPLVLFSECNVALSYSPDPPELGNPYRQFDALSLELECPRQLLFGLIGDRQITLTAQATMRVEPGGVAP